MRKMLMAAMLGGAGLFAFAPDAEAQGYGRYVRRGRQDCRPQQGLRFNFRIQSDRYRHRCVPVTQRIWVPRTRYETALVGFDRCGTPVYRTIAVPCGRYETRTVTLCRH